MKCFNVMSGFFFFMCLQAQSSYVISAIDDSQSTEVIGEIMSIAYKEIGMDIEIIPMPAFAALAKSNSGMVDAELFRINNIDKKHTNLIKVPVILSFDLGVAVTLNDNKVINGWESLYPYYIGIKRGVVFSDVGTQTMNRIEHDNINQLFKMLENNRVDVVVTTKANVRKYLFDNPEVTLHIVKPELQVVNVYHYIHKDNSHLLEPLTQVLLEMKKSGKLDEIRSKYANGY